MKKILWVSEYCVNTGFSRVSESLIKQLAKRYAITVLDIYRSIQGKYDVSYKPTPDTEIKVIGKSATGTWSANNIIQEMSGYDCIFILQDIWNINKILHAIKESGKPAPPIVVYFPVDATDHDTEWYENIDIATHLVTYTEFAKKEVTHCIDEMVGLSNAKKLKERVQIIPHGIDGETFFPFSPDAKNSLREEIYGSNAFNDHFIFLNANRNQPRKRLDITLASFKIFLQQIQASTNQPAKAILHMHCGNTDDNHINVVKLSERYGIEKNIVVSHLGHGLPNWSEEKMNKLYNAADVGLNTGIGEGWGLCNTEHASIGKPQIVPAHSACLELFSETGITVKADMPYIQDKVMTTGKIVDTRQFAEEMIDLYSDKDEYSTIAKKSNSKFLSANYGWDKISEMWIKIFDSV